MTRSTTALLAFIFVIGTNAHAQRSIRIGEANLLEEAPPRFFLDETMAPILTTDNDTSRSPGAPGVQDAVGKGVDTRTTVAYAFDGRFLLGLTYNHYQLTTKKKIVAVAEGVEQNARHAEWGPTLGFESAGWRVLFTYFVGGSQRVNTRRFNYVTTTDDVTLKSKDPTGYQLSIGYTFKVLPRLEIGPSLVYRSIKYHAQARIHAGDPSDSYGDVRLYQANVSSALSPMLSGVLRF